MPASKAKPKVVTARTKAAQQVPSPVTTTVSGPNPPDCGGISAAPPKQESISMEMVLVNALQAQTELYAARTPSRRAQMAACVAQGLVGRYRHKPPAIAALSIELADAILKELDE